MSQSQIQEFIDGDSTSFPSLVESSDKITDEEVLNRSFSTVHTPQSDTASPGSSRRSETSRDVSALFCSDLPTKNQALLQREPDILPLDFAVNSHLSINGYPDSPGSASPGPDSPTALVPSSTQQAASIPAAGSNFNSSFNGLRNPYNTNPVNPSPLKNTINHQSTNSSFIREDSEEGSEYGSDESVSNVLENINAANSINSPGSFSFTAQARGSHLTSFITKSYPTQLQKSEEKENRPVNEEGRVNQSSNKLSPVQQETKRTLVAKPSPQKQTQKPGVKSSPKKQTRVQQPLPQPLPQPRQVSQLQLQLHPQSVPRQERGGRSVSPSKHGIESVNYAQRFFSAHHTRPNINPAYYSPRRNVYNIPPSNDKPDYSRLLLKNRVQLDANANANANVSGSEGSGSGSSSPAMDSPLLNKGNGGYSYARLPYSNDFAHSTPEPSRRYEQKREQEWDDVEENGLDSPYQNERESYYSTNENSATQYYDNDEDEEDHETNNVKNTTPPAPPTFFSYIFNHELPVILGSYMQLLFNVAMMSLLIYAIWIFVSTVRHDVDQKIEEYSSDIVAEMGVCSKEYLRNNCMPGRRVPAVEKACNTWEKCMNQDPTVVGRARVSAETFGEIINSFLNPIGFKAMGFIITIFVGSLVGVNFAFSYQPHAYRFKKNAKREKREPRPRPRQAPQQPVVLYATPRHHHPSTPSFYYSARMPGTRVRTPMSTRRRK